MDQDDLQEVPCLYCWALGWEDEPCPGHRLAVRRAVCEKVR